jgi:hypothetical protein
MAQRTWNMIRNAPYRYPGRLGDTTGAIVGTGSSIVESGLSEVSSLASSGAIAIRETAAAAIPIAGAIVAVGTLIYSLFHAATARRFAQENRASATVNQAAAYLAQNLAAWNSSNKSFGNQAAALKNFDDAWNNILQICSDPQMGDPGKRCISERQRGGIYDLFTPFRDPIANDPQAGAIDQQYQQQQSLGVAGPNLEPKMLAAIAAGVILLAVLT